MDRRLTDNAHLTAYASTSRKELFHPGEWLALSGSPFGALAPGTFFNSVSVGVLSNLLQPPTAYEEPLAEPSLLAIDARCLPGHEGGPVVDAKGALVGVVTLPIRLECAGTELPLMLTLGSILSSMRSSCSQTSTSPPQTRLQRISCHSEESVPPLATAARAVVLVDMGSSWGTGVVISQHGFIITNAHVVGDERTARVRVDALQSGTTWFAASVVYSFKGPLDIAVLRMEAPPAGLPSVRLHRGPPWKGQPVVSVGHAMLSPRPRAARSNALTCGWAPTISRGHISQVLWLGPGQPAMLCSSATVHAGASGGALLHVPPCGGGLPALVGLITSNSTTNGGAILPHLNYAIPAAMLSEIWEMAEGGSLSGKSLAAVAASRQTQTLQRIWELQSEVL
mmetsp:Transcript_5244/g.14646  ORF Transcript_5244/g.14646 Transcript_5244/m.14646 type:complete len:396 (+) Transcript_5244:468-1655(+)|eukprot:CAMPEP_0117657260 /NCGR_PEP_ID=MMETSP0804-20121206/5236_1 /TAXON_ID=1074897 /ORGANISM="Tetraselmis astigmatica, Strain CCMP880" /LENGTH=395 /DNA_ID=CAMNT_0005463703 /DNA_START=436 /DNA_END=1623 /DNA_ORIENTATION=+